MNNEFILILIKCPTQPIPDIREGGELFKLTVYHKLQGFL